MTPKFHTPDLMNRIHPNLRQKYQDMLTGWKREVSNWKTYPTRASTEQYDVVPVMNTGPFTPQEDEMILLQFRHIKTKYLARIMRRNPQSITDRAHAMGIRKG